MEKYSSTMYNDVSVRIKDLSFDYDEYSAKTVIKKSFKKAFDENILTFDDFKNFIEINRFDTIAAHMTNTTENMVDWRNCTFSLYASYPTIKINVKFLFAQYHTQRQGFGYRYILCPVNFIDGEYHIDSRNKTVPLRGYKLKNMKLYSPGYDKFHV
jgi:hypothetical protein